MQKNDANISVLIKILPIGTFLAFVILLTVYPAFTAFESSSESYYEKLTPFPKQIVSGNGSFFWDHQVKIIISKEAGLAELRLAMELADVIGGKIGKRCSVEKGNLLVNKNASKQIFIGLIGQSDTLNQFDRCKAHEQSGGYVLTVVPEKISIKANDPEGMRNGTITLMQLIKRISQETPGNGRLVVPCTTICDAPSFNFRGLHLQLWPVVDIAYIKEVIDMAAKAKFNSVIFEVNKGYQYRTHPEISDKNAYSRDQMAELVQYCKDKGMLPIPAINSFGHQELLLRDAHPELVLVPKADVKPKDRQWFGKTLDTSKPQVYEILFSLYDELIEIFHPPFFLIGCDEVEGLRWQNEPHGDVIFAEHVNQIHGFFASRGIRIMIWNDMLLEIKERYESSVNKRPMTNIYKAIDLIPKSIIILDWYHSKMPGYEFNSVDFFSKRGFPVIRSSFTSPDDIKFRCSEAAGAGENVLGMLATLWYNLPERKHQLIQNTIRVSGEHFWNCPRNDFIPTQ